MTVRDRVSRRPPAAADALQSLRDGNRRFVEGVRSVDSFLGEAARRALVAAQVPIAVILSCSDSRAPSELVFDQGLGDLFVVRVAGNIAAPSLVASVEFAVAAFGTELVVVMGHSRCGIIAVTVDDLATGKPVWGNVSSIVDRVRPAVAAEVRAAIARGKTDRASLLALATRANVRASAEQLRRGSAFLAERLARSRLRIVGAEYSLETGAVDFFDGAAS